MKYIKISISNILSKLVLLVLIGFFIFIIFRLFLNIYYYQSSKLVSYNIQESLVVTLEEEKQIYKLNLSNGELSIFTGSFNTFDSQINIEGKKVSPNNEKIYLEGRELFNNGKLLLKLYEDFPQKMSPTYWSKDGKYMIKTDMKDYYYLFGALHKKFGNRVISIIDVSSGKIKQIEIKNISGKSKNIDDFVGYIK